MSVWTRELSVGNKVIDSEHKKLHGIINHIACSIVARNIAALPEAFEQLENSLCAYFAVEENIAHAINFDFTQHQLAHQHLLNEVRRIQNKLATGNYACSDEENYARCLINCLIRHIKEDGKPLKVVLDLRFPLKYLLRINKLSIRNSMHDADIASISVTKRRWRWIMHAKKIVDEMLKDCLPCLHAKQAEGVKAAVCGALGGGRLSLSQLARSVESATTMRHRVKRIDRLLGNEALHAARATIYHEVAKQWLGGIEQVLVVVDWSDVTADQQWHLLRASVSVEGRSMTLYEEVHPQHKYGNRTVHRRFLARLAKLLPTGCSPMIMTDAGFHSTWFDLVTQRRWQWIGRIRGKDMVCIAGCPWKRCTEIYAEATSRAREYSDALYVRSNPTDCRLVLIKREAKGRSRRTHIGKRSRARTSLKSARSAREPWLLACSPGLAHLSPQAIVALYAQRMRIEQSFRDTKNERGGLGLSASRSRSGKRLEILLLIGHLAGWLMRLIGESAQQCQMHLQFQSVSRLDHKEISVLTLARRVIDAGSAWLRRLRPKDSIASLHQQAWKACHGT